MTDSNYDEGSIQVLEGREAVRKRPGMYIGGTSKKGLHHILSEIVDNSIDEVMNDFATTLDVILHKDGKTLTVKDDGRGIPVKTEKSTGKSALEVVFTKLHAGGKFDQSSYKGSGGLHGVGAAVTNFLSEKLRARVWRDEKIYEIKFDKGIPQKDIEEVGTYSKYSKTEGTGTEVTFRADPEIFPEVIYDAEIIKERLEIKTYVNPGLKVLFHDRTSDKSYEFHHEDGISEYLAQIIKEDKLTSIHKKPLRVKEDAKDKNGSMVRCEIVLQWTDDTSDEIKSFVNSIPTPNGGTHESGFRQGLAKAVRSYLETSDEVPKRLDIKSEDIREGMKAVVNIFIEGEIQFQSQNKVRLNNPEAKPVIASAVRTQIEQKLFNNTDTADKIVKRIVAAAKARQASRSVKKKPTKARSAKKITLPGKLSDCSSDDPTKCEIFLVEGDSAGGSAKMARDRETQAILPLRGKVLNSENSSLKRILKNKELSGIVEALGCGIGDGMHTGHLRYQKIILLMDADSDGHHISTLLLTFFYRHMPELIEGGFIYLAQPPLYRVEWGKDRYWALSDQQKDAIIKKIKKKGAKNIDVSRFKGLGEMMPKTLKETTLDPKSRKLIEVEIPDAQEKETDKIITSLMGRKSSKRYDMIMKNLALIDDLDV